MRHRRWFRSVTARLAVALALVAPGLWLTVAPPAEAAGTLTQFTTTVGGVSRSYYEYIPNNLPSGARPLVFALHGGTQNAYDAATDPKLNGAAYYWRTVADTDGVVLVYPQAAPGDPGSPNNGAPNWNDCRSEAQRLPDVDDVAFFDQMITEVSGRHSIDSQRIYSAGSSNGGMMSYRLALELSNKFAAVSANAALMAVDPNNECPDQPANPITVAVMQGDGDPMMPYAGGCVSGNCSYEGQVISADATVTYWRSFLGANGGGTLYTYANTNTLDKSKVERRVYTGGSQGTEVPYFKVVKTGTNGAGHAMPSLCCQITWGVELIVKKQNKDIEGIQEIWNYLKNHTLTS